MTAEIIYGKDVIENWKLNTVDDSVYPTLVILVFGDDPESAIYVKNKEKQCLKYGIKCITYHLLIHGNDETGHWLSDAVSIIEESNQNKDVIGIMVQLPIPQATKEDERFIIDQISPKKDVDGLTTVQMGKLLAQTDFSNMDGSMFVPATARGIIHILDYILERKKEITYRGWQAVVVGRSNLVGRPVAILLERVFNMTVTVVHSKTSEEVRELALKNADLIVTAVGTPNIIKGEDLKEGCIVIDAGTSYIEKNGKKTLVGDVDFESAKEVCGMITPVPKGVGEITVHALMNNILDAYSRAYHPL